MSKALNSTAAALLGFLHRGPMSGWDLLTTAREVIGDFWTVTRSQVYRELAAMDRDGLVVAGEAGARDRRPYELTEAGRSAFEAWLREPPGSEQIRYPLLLTISFGAHLPPERLAEFLAEHRSEHIARLARYRERAATLPTDPAGPDLYTAATLDFGIRYESAVLAWLDGLPSQLSGAPPP